MFFSQHLKVSNVLESLMAAGNSFQIVQAEKLKKLLLKLLVLEGIHCHSRAWGCRGRCRACCAVAYSSVANETRCDAVATGR